METNGAEGKKGSQRKLKKKGFLNEKYKIIFL